MAGLFDTFTTAKRGLAVQQANINVNAHNTANVKTPGYSRQRAVIETTRPFGGNSRFDVCSAGQVGTGAQVTTIMRIRNSFIDYQLRNEYARVGNYKVQKDFLSQVDDTFGEPSDTSIQKLFSKFYSAFGDLATRSDMSPTGSAGRTVAVTQAQTLANALNQTYKRLEDKITQAQGLLQDNVREVNKMINEINDYNKQIRNVSSIGLSPNDLMDARDQRLDDLSHKFGITVSPDQKNSINLKIENFPASGDKIYNLVNSEPTDDKYTRLSYINGVNTLTTDATGNITKIEIKYYKLGDSQTTPQSIIVEAPGGDLTALKESLEQNRVLIGDKDGTVGEYDASGNFTAFASTTPITEAQMKKSLLKLYENDSAVNTVDDKDVKGEIAGNQSVQKMIKGYMNELDKIAKCLAYSVNAIQTGTDGITPAASDISSEAVNLLFVNSDITASKSDNKISAKNITVNKDIVDDVFKLNCGKDKNSGPNNADRAQAIANLDKINMDIASVNVDAIDTRAKFFSGVTVGSVTINPGVSFDGVNLKGNTTGKVISAYYKDMITTLGTKEEEANDKVKAQTEKTIYQLEQSRSEESGVSLDEEVADLVQFQHAYQANAKMISTIDELLDVVINQLKR